LFLLDAVLRLFHGIELICHDSDSSSPFVITSVTWEFLASLVHNVKVDKIQVLG
jgi:hypothetical protein